MPPDFDPVIDSPRYGATNVVALQKENGEQYVVLYDNESIDEALRVLGKHASDPELSFNWYDAAYLSKKIRELEAQAV